jgi:hypothetical protein
VNTKISSNYIEVTFDDKIGENHAPKNKAKNGRLTKISVPNLGRLFRQKMGDFVVFLE